MVQVLLSYPVGVGQQEAVATGFYLPGEVGQLAGVSGNQIGQWAHYGYMQSEWADSHPRIYAFQDIAEAMVLHYLRDHGVPYPSIRRALDKAREEYGLRWPLSRARLYIVADHPQAEGPKRTVVVDGRDVIADHPVLGSLDLIEVKRDLMRGGWAVRNHPEITRIVVDPDIRSGTPVVKGTRMAAQDVAEIAASPDGRALLRRDYELRNPQIDDAVAWWEIVRSYDANWAGARVDGR